MPASFEYQKAYQRMVDSAMKGFVKDDALVGEVRRYRSRHDGPSRNVAGEDPLDHDQAEVSFGANIACETTRNLDIDAHSHFVAELAQSQVDALKAMFLQRAGEVCSAVGNSKDMEGAPISYDMVLDLLEMVSIQFDSEGNPIMPSLVIHPEMMKALMKQPKTPEHERRRAEIMARKKEDWFNNLRTRRMKPL